MTTTRQIIFVNYLGAWVIETLDESGEVVDTSWPFHSKEGAEAELRWLKRKDRKAA